jgi:ribosome-associated protein YbcJ (S4-like RNA binding protein)
MKPTEGTILTVARVAAEKGAAAAEIDPDPVYVWDAICLGAAEALSTTPELLPVLKKAGVVDAGGQGLCMIFDGMMQRFQVRRDRQNRDVRSRKGRGDRRVLPQASRRSSTARSTSPTARSSSSAATRRVTTEPNELRLFLETIGDCVVVVDDEEIIKVHVHTEQPAYGAHPRAAVRRTAHRKNRKHEGAAQKGRRTQNEQNRAGLREQGAAPAKRKRRRSSPQSRPRNSASSPLRPATVCVHSLPNSAARRLSAAARR